MDRAEFWKIIDRVHAANEADMEAKCQGLHNELAKLNDAELKSFIDHFDEADANAYDWKLWGAAYLIGGGCSDDAFQDFRATLISMGREFYESALTNPDSLAMADYSEESAFYEGFQYVKNNAAKDRFGKIPLRSTPFPSRPSGTEWDDGDLLALLPALAKKHA